MSHKPSESSSRSNSSDHTFPFQHEDHETHQTLLPDGILDDEDDVVPWPRKSSKEDSSVEKTVALRVRKLPQDLSAREFAGLFLMADGFVHSDLVVENEERVGIASFASQNDAEKAKQKMSSVSSGPYARLTFEVTSKRPQDMLTPPATLSSSSRSTGSNGSMPQISRLASYVKERSNESQIGLDDFYGNGVSLPKSGGLPSSVPNNFSTSGGTTVWSPTSPRYTVDLGKSPPNGLSMLPPISNNKEDDSWNRSGTQNSLNSSRFSQLSLNNAPPGQSQDVRVQKSPVLNSHAGGPSPIYASIDDSLHANNDSRSSYNGSATPQNMYTSTSPPKQYMAGPAYIPAGGPGVFGNHHRMGPPMPVNTNPADQNPPCNTLYVGNLPLATTEEELKSLFSRQPGYRRLCYRTKSNGPMCFVEFEDVHYAINSLKLLQGVVLSSSIKGGIRLSFSKNPLGVRKMDGGGGHQVVQGGMISPVVNNNGAYNAMHAPPGLQSGQLHGHAQQQASVNPGWR
ncbi:Cell wall integrity protein scw1 [Taphrina deformans PYCC 5710]|uniref:Cell wall integrity protein scw1 n=1 Tax=Taphrina deformans (strain PYCC 5710 / ATCC 11124 / CBS 356.35 / IMI 108563 / JCM 9778 / NBRC 8474) TaxID=1097556 RepID=R4X7K8_TAPDE|nr:Cell wall integrity protein scw1 [Taphrina deformans PYCC 5710]|eukprot:CCG81406.1 Cell wall integrity protein scw1 [Taphrina deformans PYCC 5710]